MSFALLTFSCVIFQIVLRLQFCMAEPSYQAFVLKNNSSIIDSSVISNLKDVSLLQCASSCSSINDCKAASYDRDTRECFLDSGYHINTGQHTTVVLSKTGRPQFLLQETH